MDRWRDSPAAIAARLAEHAWEQRFLAMAEVGRIALELRSGRADGLLADTIWYRRARLT